MAEVGDLIWLEEIIIPAALNATIASGTPSCSRSSMPVAPNSVKSVSSKEYESRIFFSRFSIDTSTSLCRLHHSANSAGFSTRFAITNTRSPCRAYISNCCWVRSRSRPASDSGRQFTSDDIMALSAPFVYKMSSLVVMWRTTTDIHFRLESKGSTLRTSYS